MRIESSNLTWLNYHEAEQNSASATRQVDDQITTTTAVQESEKLTLGAQGSIQLLGGKTVEISMQSQLSRYDSFSMTSTQSLAQMTDPLVVNLQGDLAQIDASKTFSFDLNSDGTKEDISLLGRNNGFLALDVNGNGVIDDGSELFGTKSGNGFADLAAYDEDGNGWIDENDSVFSKLKIWQKSASQDKLISLSQARVGALLLENIDSSFTYKNGADTNATLQKSSVVLFENGRSGWMSHVDFALANNENTTTTASANAATSTTTSVVSLGQSMLSKMSSTSVSDQSDSLLSSLKSRLRFLQNKLSKTKNSDEKTGIMMQILKISTQIMQLGG